MNFDNNSNQIVAGKYLIKRKIGNGSFGEVYLGLNEQTNEEVAIKFESAQTQYPQLAYESKVYRLIKCGVGIPNMHWSGIEGGYNIMVLDLLGPSLEDLFTLCHRQFSLKTVLMLADQMISRIEFFHKKNLLHRDIKPDNFLIGLVKKVNQVYMVDFGLAKKYKDPVNHWHISYREGKRFLGTARYASINAHLGIEQSRRDDFEGLGYVLMYFLRGNLPWMGIHRSSRSKKYNSIMLSKLEIRTEVLCEGFPEEMTTYMNYCKGLRFEEKPDYAYLKKLFKDLYIRENYQYDFMYDWTIINCIKNIGCEESNNERCREENVQLQTSVRPCLRIM